MIIAIHAGAASKERLTKKGWGEGIEVRWLSTVREMATITDALAFIDMDFDPGHIADYPSNLVTLCNAPVHTLSELGRDDIIRFNGWPGFFEGNALEVAFSPGMQDKARQVFDKLGWNFIPVPDIPGMVGARIQSMIINEACFAIEEGVSTEEEIDLAMKLGTNYPHGPVEWGRRIGIVNVVTLLEKLAAGDEAYTPSSFLRKLGSR